MKTLEQEIADLKEKHAQDARDLERKHAVIAALGSIADGYDEPKINHFPLYGSVGSIGFDVPFSSYTAKGKAPDRALLAALLATFAPVSRVQVRDGCLSNRPAFSVLPGETQAREKTRRDYDATADDWKGELLDICPVTVDIDDIEHGGKASFQWFAYLPGGLYRFDVEFSLYGVELGRLETRRRYADSAHNYPVGWEVCQFYPTCGAQCIRWAAGGTEYPNHFTLWWDVDSGKATDFPALVKEAPKAV
jgi:hypothetical protein